MKIVVIKKLFSADFEKGQVFWKERGKGRPVGRPAGTVCDNGYVGVTYGKKRPYAHQIIWALYSGEWLDEFQIDHINHNRQDNRISNLRKATNAQNGKNLPIKVNNTSGYPGVCWDKANNKWRATIKVDGKQINLGRYVSKEEAIAVRKVAEKKYFGEFARAA